jgi:hypothetical protein
MKRSILVAAVVLSGCASAPRISSGAPPLKSQVAEESVSVTNASSTDSPVADATAVATECGDLKVEVGNPLSPEEAAALRIGDVITRPMPYVRPDGSVDLTRVPEWVPFADECFVIRGFVPRSVQMTPPRNEKDGPTPGYKHTAVYDNQTRKKVGWMVATEKQEPMFVQVGSADAPEVELRVGEDGQPVIGQTNLDSAPDIAKVAS